MSWLIFRRRRITFSKTTLDLILIFFLMLLFYGQPLLNPTRMSFGGEAMNLFLPALEHYREAVYHGYVPLWNSHTWLGAPFLATFQSMTLYPPQLISLFFDSTPIGSVHAQNFLIFLSLIWLAYGAYFFGLWALDLERYASMLMALIMGCSGFVGGHIDHVNQLAAISWIPWIMGQALIILRTSKWHNMALMAIFIGMQVLAGHPQYVVYSIIYLGVLVACYSVYFYHRRRAEDPPGWHGIVMILCAVVLGAGLASAQVLPAAELSEHSVRPFDNPDRMFVGSFPPVHIFASFIPGIYGSAADGLHTAFEPGFIFPPTDERMYPFDEFVCYVGLFPIILTMIAIVGLIRESIVRAFSILALFSIVVASGNFLVDGWIYRFIMMWFPGGLGFRVPARFMIFYTLSISVLAGVGLNYVSHYLLERRRFRRLAVWPICAFVLLVVFIDLGSYSLDQAFRYFGNISVLNEWSGDNYQGDTVLEYLTQEGRESDSRIYRNTGNPPFGSDLHFYLHSRPYVTDRKFWAATIRVHSFQPNLNRLWDLQTVHGYEEGLLPTMNYRTFIGHDGSRNLIGRFHSNLGLRETGLPDGEATIDATFLGLLNVKYVMAQR
ncbi:MAG: hypothetical protein ACOC2L_01710, partial [Candidatus Sumerlaeota bacterium]